MATAQQTATQASALAQRGSAPVMGFVLSHEQFPVTDLLDYGVRSEAAGFDTIWTSDHFQPWQDNQGHAGMAWVTLSTLAARTSRIGFGTGVTCPTFRYEPAVVAQAWATMSQFAPGRPFIGLGTGEKLNEGAAGGGWGLYPERAERLVEAVTIMRRLWSGEQVNFHGRYYTVEGRLYDPPAQPIPLYIAAGGPKSAFLSGMHGDGLIADPSMLKSNPEYKAAWEEGARAAGKDPATMPMLIEHFVSVSDEQGARSGAELWRFLAKNWQPGYFNNISPLSIQERAQREIPLEQVIGAMAVSTDPAKHVEAIQQLVDKGVTHIFVHSAQQDQRAVIDFFGSQVLPKVRDGGVAHVRKVA